MTGMSNCNAQSPKSHNTTDHVTEDLKAKVGNDNSGREDAMGWHVAEPSTTMERGLSNFVLTKDE